MFVFSGCKVMEFRNIYQISCIIRKIYLNLQFEKKNLLFGGVLMPGDRIKF